ncbi:carbohydrate ABC transporter permease [Actinocrinis puniceicyclus]|uniref:Carbohydrate ABC transporter permease n=2 Tax=Actinocrinis puniceicyclus TaxID=977794 RepID=A0A8J7WKX2_9ACTN|nr:carbohydrate ABC transporter permease [Actinocrinis puniceicyclus]
MLWAIYTSLRPYSETQSKGYLSLPSTLNFQNYIDAWNQSGMPHYFWNTVMIAVPAVLLTLLLSSFVAFTVTQYNLKINLLLLMVFTAGNLLPQQVIITPLYRLYLLISLPSQVSDSGKMYDTIIGLVVIHVAFQSGFCTFVLSNYMKTIPTGLREAAVVDGATVWQIYSRIILPLLKPAVAALATLLSIWIYNDFFWAIVLISSGDKMPITSSLANLSGTFFTNDNLVAAGALLTAVPTLLVYFLLQRQFVSGLTLGAEKG